MPLPVFIAGLGVAKIAAYLAGGAAVAVTGKIAVSKWGNAREREGIVRASNEYEDKYDSLKQDFQQQMDNRDKNINTLNEENRCLNELLLKFKLDFVRKALADPKLEHNMRVDLIEKQKQYESELTSLTIHGSMLDDEVYHIVKQRVDETLNNYNLTNYNDVIHRLDLMNIDNNFFMYLDAVNASVGGLCFVIGQVEFGNVKVNDKISVVKSDSVFHREFTVSIITRTPKGLVIANKNTPGLMVKKYFDILRSGTPIESMMVDSASDGHEVGLFLRDNNFDDFEPGDYFIVESVTG